MLIVYIINTIIGIVIFSISCMTSSLFYQLSFSVLAKSNSLLFIPILLLSLIVFYFSVLAMAITCCRMIVFFTPIKTGNFPNTSKIQLLRVVTDVLASHLCSPLYSSMPFLVSWMGAQTGTNLIFSGKLFNADILNVGNNVLIGEDAFLCGHLQQANKMILGNITIGNEVTIGVRSFIMPDVIIGDRSIIAAYSVVPMGTRIPPDEIWGGIPAKKIGQIRES